MRLPLETTPSFSSLGGPRYYNIQSICLVRLVEMAVRVPSATGAGIRAFIDIFDEASCRIVVEHVAVACVCNEIPWIPSFVCADDALRHLFSASAFALQIFVAKDGPLIATIFMFGAVVWVMPLGPISSPISSPWQCRGSAPEVLKFVGPGCHTPCT
ncbi:unnamed protein product [Symbiodinium natans]|uniref:Uncharacterized protein n=1 Tax=Symbiodinium natans TaxID=878477 RepID=A0A812M1B9_9DINO|nr:unnamed protein product [Symbiodinium natans]